MEKKIQNYGISLLRVFLTFLVVLSHFWEWDNRIVTKPIYTLIQCAVPSFMLLSFYLMSKMFVSIDEKKIKLRMKRILLPFLFWSVISWLIYVFIESILKSNDDINFLNVFFKLFWQLFTGHAVGINPPLWYLASLFWLTILYFCIFKIFKFNAIYVIVLLLLFSFILEYTGLNYLAFGKMRYEIKYPLGRFVEMIPYATIGIIIGKYNIFDFFLNRYKRILLFYIGIVLWIIVFFLLIFDLEKIGVDFGYSGVLKILISILNIFLFYILPISKINNKKFKVDIFLKFTLGIYITHYLIGNILINIMPNINRVLMCFMIYIVCYFISLAIYYIPINNSKCLVD